MRGSLISFCFKLLNVFEETVFHKTMTLNTSLFYSITDKHLEGNKLSKLIDVDQGCC